jgi:hypothetical protein
MYETANTGKHEHQASKADRPSKTNEMEMAEEGFGTGTSKHSKRGKMKMPINGII